MASSHLLSQFEIKTGTTSAQLTTIGATNFAPGALIYLPDDTGSPSLKIVVQAANGTKSFKTVTIS